MVRTLMMIAVRENGVNQRSTAEGKVKGQKEDSPGFLSHDNGGQKPRAEVSLALRSVFTGRQ